MCQATLKAKSIIRKLPPSCGSDCHGRMLPLEEFARIPRLHPRFIARFVKNCNRRDNKYFDSFQLERHGFTLLTFNEGSMYKRSK